MKIVNKYTREAAALEGFQSLLNGDEAVVSGRPVLSLRLHRVRSDTLLRSYLGLSAVAP